jgi:predicted RNA methylase
METKVIDIRSEAFSSVDLVHQCLIDTNKAEAFKETLQNVVQKNSTVLECGTGSGILSLIAAQAGAKAITAIEFDPYIANVAKDNISLNGKDHIITVLTEDARNITFPNGTHFDIIIMEMINTGLIEEMQVQAMNNLHAQNLITLTTVLIPAVQETYITLAYTDFKQHGFTMKMVKQMWQEIKSDAVLSRLSGKQLLNRIDFSSPTPELFTAQIQFEVEQSGEINSIILSGKTILNKEETIVLDSTFSLNPDIIIPLPEERNVEKGEIIALEIEYIFGGGFQTFKADYAI